jgi:imidazolonepropionase-like amidohydrolase
MLLTARWLFDGRTPDVAEGWGIEIAEERIVNVGPVGEMRTTGDVVDLGDATLLPGLVDVHTHLGFDASDDPVGHLQASDDATLLGHMERAAQRALAVGVTTVRDLGDRGYLSLELRERFRRGDAVRPRIVASGPPITVPNGHCWFLGGEVEGIDGIRQAVRDRVAHGVDVIKMMATGGVMTPNAVPGLQELDDDELRAGVAEARKAGKRTASHAQGSAGVLAAVRAGIDSIEHGFFLTDEIVREMRERGTFFSATLVAARGIAEAPEGTVPDWARLKARAAVDAHAESFTMAYAAGVKLVLGTDAGTPFNHHGQNAQELELMVQAGLSPTEGLLAATRNGADLLGILDRVGTLEPGKDADLLLVRGDATRDVTTILADGGILAVVRGGRLAVDNVGT